MRRRFDAVYRQYVLNTTNEAEWHDGVKSRFPSVKLLGKSQTIATPMPDAPQKILCNNATVQSVGDNFSGGEATAPDLFAVHDYRDEWNSQTGKGIRRVSKKVLKGTETVWVDGSADNGTLNFRYRPTWPEVERVKGSNNTIMSSHWSVPSWIGDTYRTENGGIAWVSNTNSYFMIVIGMKLINSGVVDEATWKAWLAEQYSAGTPVTIYWAAVDTAFETEPAPLNCPMGHGQIVQTGGDIPNCPIEVKYLAHGGGKA